MRRWFSLTRIASSRPARWLAPPPQRTAYFSSARRPGVVLRVSRMVAPVPSTAADVARGQRRDPAEAAEQVERRALAGEHGARRALELARGGSGASVTRAPSSTQRIEARRAGRAPGTPRARHRTPQATPGSSSSSSARQRASAGTTPSVVRSPRADVLGERGPHHAVERLGGQLHRSSTGSWPRRRTTWRSNAAVLGRVVRAEVAAAALAPRERALGDEPRQQRRRVEQPLEPGGGADQARILPQGTADLGRHRPRSERRAGPRRSRPRSGSAASAAERARRPKTRHSSSEFEASRFAPWTPVQAHSPAA